MKKSLIISVIILNGFLTFSLSAMFNAAKKMRYKLQQKKYSLKKDDEIFNRGIMGTRGEMMAPWRVVDEIDQSYENEPNIPLKDKIDLNRELLVKALSAYYICDRMLNVELDNRQKWERSQLSFIRRIKNFFSEKYASSLRRVHYDRFMDSWMANRRNYINGDFPTILEHETMKNGIYKDMDGWDFEKTENCKKKLANRIVVLRNQNAYLEHVCLKKNNHNENNE